MEDHVVDLVVPVHECAPVQWLRVLLREECHHVVEVGEFADGFVGVGVDDRGLRFGDCLESGDLPVEESCRFAEGFESDAFGVYAVELGEGLYCILPPGGALVSKVESLAGAGGGCWSLNRVTYSAFLSSPLTPGIAGSVKCRPSRNSMM